MFRVVSFFFFKFEIHISVVKANIILEYSDPILEYSDGRTVFKSGTAQSNHS